MNQPQTHRFLTKEYMSQPCADMTYEQWLETELLRARRMINILQSDKD